MNTIKNATEAFRYLNGFFCIYKPSGLPTIHARKTILFNLSSDLNEMETRPPKDYIQLEGSVASGKPLAITVMPSFSDHPLVVGPRYQPHDIRCRNLNSLGKKTSGVQLYALNDACIKYDEFKAKNLVQLIEVKGEFGYMTDTGFSDGRVSEKATYKFVKRHQFDALLSSIEASHQAAAQSCSKAHIESQEAYEAACKGVVRPKEQVSTLMFNIMCTEFNLPSFTIQMHCFNAEENFLAQLVTEIGFYMKSCATCTQIRQIQYGPFTLDYALLRKHWRVEHIISNIMLCKTLLTETMLPTDGLNIHSLEKSKINTVIHKFQERAKQDIMDNFL